MRAIVLLLAAVLCCGSANAQVPHKINFQGYLTAAGNAPITATVSMQFKLYTVDTGGAPVYNETQSIVVANGIFNALIGTPAPIPGTVPFDQPYYLGITVGADAEMTPRQFVAATPYAIRAATSDALALGAALPASLTGVVPAANIADLGASYIKNSGAAQTGNFNISGTGTAGTFAAATQYNLGGQRILSAAGSSNLFAGVFAGFVNTGTGNAFYGFQAGVNNSSGSGNSFFGTSAGEANTSGGHNSFVGINSGKQTALGSDNTFFGFQAGLTNAAGTNNTALGSFTDVASGALDHATAIGAGAVVASSNSVVLGRTTDNVGIGTTSPTGAKLVVKTPTSSTGLNVTDGNVALTAQILAADAAFGVQSNHPLTIVAKGTLVVKVDVNAGVGEFNPYVDGTVRLGTGALRFTELHAINGTIQTSDARLKKAVANLGYGLKEVMQMRPVTFQWKDRSDGRNYPGLIAQEVVKLIPEAVERDKDPAVPLGMNYTSLVPVLIKAAQELNRQLEKQAAEYAAQGVEMARQTTRIAELEKQGLALATLTQQMAELQTAVLMAERRNAASLAVAH